MMEVLLSDIRYGIRMLLKRPGFALVAVLTLALGVGANTAIFSVINAVLLNPLPYEKSSELVLLWVRPPGANGGQSPVSIPDFSDWRTQSSSFQQMVATRTVSVNLTDGDEPARATGARVSAGFVSLFKINPVAGRDFLDSETQPGAAPVALIGYSLWRQRYGGDESLIGRALSMDNTSYTIVGVLPPGFAYPTPETQVYIPLVPAKSEVARGSRFLRIIARLSPGVAPTRAQVEMDTIASRIAEQYPDSNSGCGVEVVPLHEQIVGQIRPTLMILFGAAACVLLIACANVANLLLARATSRAPEFAIRTAMGAPRRRLVRQMLTESVLLSLAGGLLGSLIAMWGVPALTSISASSIPRVEEVAVNARVLLFTLGVSVATGIAFGLAPSLQSSSRRFIENLKDGRRGAAGGAFPKRALNVMIVAEVALAVVLLTGAGLMVRSFASISSVEPGFNPKGVVMVGIALTQPIYANVDEQARFYERLIDRVSSLAGVESAAGIHRVPLLGFNSATSFSIQGKPVEEGNEPTADCRIITRNYFKTMGIPLIEGREFTNRDSTGSPEVVVINRAMADQFLGGEEPVGKSLQIYPKPPRWREIVGVAGDVKLTSLDAVVNPAVYVPLSQNPYAGAMRSGFLVVRTSVDPDNLAAAIRGEIRTLDRGVAIGQVSTLEDIVSDSLAPRRLSMWLLVAFAGLAATLAAVGIYGVMSYSVTERTREIGIRMALGADSRSVLKMVLFGGAKLAAAGVVTGLAGAFALTRLMTSLLFQISPTDPLTYGLIAVGIACVALFASCMPARKASRVDPIVALRYD